MATADSYTKCAAFLTWALCDCTGPSHVPHLSSSMSLGCRWLWSSGGPSKLSMKGAAFFPSQWLCFLL